MPVTRVTRGAGSTSVLHLFLPETAQQVVTKYVTQYVVFTAAAFLTVFLRKVLRPVTTEAPKINLKKKSNPDVFPNTEATRDVIHHLSTRTSKEQNPLMDYYPDIFINGPFAFKQT